MTLNYDQLYEMASRDAGQGLAVLVPAHRNDALGAQLLGGENPGKAHGAVADHRNCLARPDFGGHGGEPTRAQDVRSRQQMRNLLIGRL